MECVIISPYLWYRNQLITKTQNNDNKRQNRNNRNSFVPCFNYWRIAFFNQEFININPLNFNTMNQLTSHKPVSNLLSKGATNSKTAKNEIETFILYLAPADTIGLNLCPFASEGCKKSCLYSAGRGRFSNVQESRINKAKFWAYDRENFYIQLTNEILKIQARAQRESKKIAIRLNGTSDIDHIELINRFTGVNVLSLEGLLFYDYTKNPNHIKKYIGTNYKLTFSRSESNEQKALDVLNSGGNVAVVFSSSLPDTFKGFRVIDGDLTDLRYFDPTNVVIGLKAKGDAKKDRSGFVVAS